MKRRFLAIHPLLGTKHKPSPPSALERSPYYWWWAYLRRNDNYWACCEQGGARELAWLYADFGDVRPDDFRAWWGGSLQRGQLLFSEEPMPLRLEKLKSKADWREEWTDDEVVVIAFNRSVQRQKLQEYFAHLLQKEEIGRRGRLALASAKSTARYPLYRNFSQYNLKVMLAAYDAWKANEHAPKDERKTLWQLGERLKLVPTAITTAKDTKYELTHKRNVMNVAVSRYVKQAKAIIANTSNGQFPNSQKPPSI